MSIASEEVRRRAIEAYEKSDQTQAQIAIAYNISIRTFQRWLENAQKGIYNPLTRGHPKRIFNDERLHELDQIVQQKPDATLAEIQASLSFKTGITTIVRALANLAYDVKKNAARQRANARGRSHRTRQMA